MKISREQAEALRMVPMYTYRHRLLPDGSHPIRTVTYANVAEVGWGHDDVLHLVVAHGAWGGPTSFGPIARTALRAAGAANRPATATLYSDPLFGFGRYAQDHRTERYERVVQARAAELDRPVHLVAHSWNAAGSLAVATTAAKEGQAASWVGYTPANRTLPGNITFGEFVRSSRAERKQGGTYGGPQSLAIISAVAAGVVMHGLALPTAIKEAAATFNTRLNEGLVALESVLPAGVVLAGEDFSFGRGEPAARLLREAGFKGAIGVLAGVSHVGAAANFNNGVGLYHVLDAIVSPDAPGNSVYYPSETFPGQPATGWGRLA